MITNLISIKLKWYANNLMKTLYEYSVALLIFGAIFVFGVFNLTLITKPVAILLVNNQSLKLTSFYLLILNLIFIVLFTCQKKMIFSQAFETFIQTLPIRKVSDRISSIFILFISNNFLWILLFLGAYSALISQPSLMIVFETLFLIFSLLAIQLCIHEKNINKFILICLCNVVFVFTKSYLSIKWFNVTTALLTVVISVVSLIDIKTTHFSISKEKQHRIGALLSGPVLSVQLAMLRSYRGLCLTKIFLSLAFQALSAIIAIHTNENPNLIYIIMLINYITICIMSSFSRLLAIESKKMAAYFLSLPVEKYYWFKKNQIFNLTSTCLVMFPFMAFALWHAAFSLLMLGYTIISILIINAVTYYINLKQLRNTTIRLSLVVLVLYTVQFFMR